MKTSVVREKWAKNQPALCCALNLTDPAVWELTSLLGFDCIWMDLEHRSLGLETAESLMRAARVGRSDVLARPAKGEFMRLGRLLEAGAQGIMYPRCDSANEAAEVARWAKFAPLGTRGVDGAGPDVPYCSMPLERYTLLANEQTFLMIQIEDPRALEEAEKIAAVPGVDGLFFGPGDFSVLAGIPEQFDHAMIRDAQRRIAAAAKSAGKVWGMPAFSINHAREILQLNCKLIAYGADIVLLKDGLQRIQNAFGALGFKFNDLLKTNGELT